jgi:alkanesulfonate monooxygenase SsuD/methylene tetrahydromethanopterin reductase-like flavin-dependent oxidoreductase (luciferase family)
MKVGAAVPLVHEPAVRYSAIREFARLIEQGGLDSVWVFDHLLFRRPEQPTSGGWEAWTMLSALAEATQRAELGMLVAAVPFRNPAVFAKMIATLDEVSDGRMIAGLGAGWHEPSSMRSVSRSTTASRASRRRCKLSRRCCAKAASTSRVASIKRRIAS